MIFAGLTANPTGAWTTQAARNLFLRHAVQLTHAKALVRDRGSQFIDTFDEIFRTEGSKILKTQCALRSRTRSPSAGSDRSDASSSTEPSSGTAVSSNASSSTTPRTTTSTGHTGPFNNDHPRGRASHHRHRQRPSPRSERPDATDSSTNTKPQPDQGRHNFRAPQGDALRSLMDRTAVGKAVITP